MPLDLGIRSRSNAKTLEHQSYILYVNTPLMYNINSINMDTTGPVDEIIHAATVISSTMPRIKVQNLLSHHRQQLQSALDSLQRVLRSRPSSDSNNQQGHAELEGSRSLSPVHPEQVDTLDSTNNGSSQHAINIRDNGREDPEPLQSGSPSQSQPPIEEKIKSDVENFMEKIKKQSEKIRSFTNKNERDAISQGEDWTGLDPRLVDIKLAARGSTLTAKFRAGLARYSFANDYLDWAEKHSEKPRHEFLNKETKDADNRGSGCVSKYLDEIGQNTEEARKAIQYGLKYHSIEYIYGSCGVCAFLFFVFAAFRGLTYGHLQLLAASIRKSEWSAFSEAKAHWVSNCLSIYVENCTTYRYRQSGQKRSFEPECLEQRQNKRTELDFTSTFTIETREQSEAREASLSLTEVGPPHGNDETTLSSELQFGFDPFEWDWAFLLQIPDTTSEPPLDISGHSNSNPDMSRTGGAVSPLSQFNPLVPQTLS
ncbi:hypothetical protein ASPZODRAFT_1670980 [Penicilliopsis zonata CBS 506.65]|uniref:Uncharacterized protein n=1 Tax=Penicilliopsis zonata CBS 506.65 TaxID=1073090 RepID=A0A1L9S4G5_9EURO|nr:hypothetical protein ASPZODRAFT_1670980 [Penicilliopsis zonata CBS 506.65]OJJ42049.1 hypothetical protein ASPZODRAFT_1670980 [Penicilliopsis zonata CBS 506.65]